MTKSTQFDVAQYFGAIASAMYGCDDQILAAYGCLAYAKQKKHTVWCLGNGGSMAVAQHFAQDLLKLSGVRAQAINCPSILTAYSNDDGFEASFFGPVSSLILPGDVIVIFSCSGRSRNYIEFVSGFAHVENPIIAIIGTDGGFLKEKVPLHVHVKSNDYQVCETAFCIVADLLVKRLWGAS